MLPTVTRLEYKKETVHQAYIIAVESWGQKYVNSSY